VCGVKNELIETLIGAAFAVKSAMRQADGGVLPHDSCFDGLTLLPVA
jgi:hypothetical protein